jgi:hypothetical protein
VTPDDANRALIIYGPEVLHLKKDAMEWVVFPKKLSGT